MVGTCYYSVITEEIPLTDSSVRRHWWDKCGEAVQRTLRGGSVLREERTSTIRTVGWWMDAWIMGAGGDLPATEARSGEKWGEGGKKSWRLSYKNRQTAMMNSHERSEEMRGRVLLLYWPSWERHLLVYRAPTWPPLYSVTEYSAEENVARLMALRCNKFQDGSDSFLRWTPASAWYHVW